LLTSLHGRLPRGRRAGYDYAVGMRRIWHYETGPLCDALEEAGAWQTALRVRLADRDALEHRPEGSAFDYRPTPEDTAALGRELDALRARQSVRDE
jgi:hypothetical protein